MDAFYAYDQFPNHFEHAIIDDCIDNYIFLVDHSQNALSPMQLSHDHFYEDEIIIPDYKELILKGQTTHFFFSKRESMHRQLSFQNQHVSEHGYEDPIAILLESYLSDSLKILDFIISLTLLGEYDFLKEFISLLVYFCYSLLISDKDEIISVIKLHEWLLWKFAFT